VLDENGIPEAGRSNLVRFLRVVAALGRKS
jgi:hypothetical protein